MKRILIALGISLFAGVASLHAQSPSERVIVTIDPVATLDPAHARSTGGNLSVLSQVYSSLTTIDADGRLIGELAESWTVDSATQFTFRLRSGAVFENGKPLDANTVVANFSRVRDPELKATSNTGFGAIESVTAADPLTVVIRTKEPWLDLPRRLSWFFFVEPEWAGTANPKTEINASGAYRIKSYEPGGDIVLVRNPSFYGKSPSIEEVTYRGLGNAATRIAGIKAGEIFATLRIDPIDLGQLAGLDDYVTGARDGQRYHVLKFNYSNPALADLRVRQAINYAIDKEAIAKAVFRGFVGAGSAQVLNPTTEGYDTAIEPWPYDAGKARQLLAEAGYASGLILGLTASAESTSVSVPPIVQVLAAQLAEVGITIKINLVPNSEFSALRNLPPEQAPDLSYTGYVSQSNSAIELFGQYTSKGPNSFGPQPTRFDEAVARVSAATDEKAVRSAISEASNVAIEDALFAFLWLQPQTFAISKKIEWKPRSDDWIRATEINLK